MDVVILHPNDMDVDIEQITQVLEQNPLGDGYVYTCVSFCSLGIVRVQIAPPLMEERICSEAPTLEEAVWQLHNVDKLTEGMENTRPRAEDYSNASIDDRNKLRRWNEMIEGIVE